MRKILFWEACTWWIHNQASYRTCSPEQWVKLDQEVTHWLRNLLSLVNTCWFRVFFVCVFLFCWVVASQQGCCAKCGAALCGQPSEYFHVRSMTWHEPAQTNGSSTFGTKRCSMDTVCRWEPLLHIHYTAALSPAQAQTQSFSIVLGRAEHGLSPWALGCWMPGLFLAWFLQTSWARLPQLW